MHHNCSGTLKSRLYIAVALLLAGLSRFDNAAVPDQAADLLTQAQALTQTKTPESLHNAIPLFEKARALASASGNQAQTLQALIGIAFTYFLLHEYKDELKPLEDATALAKQLHDEATEGLALTMTGHSYRLQNDLSHSASAFEQAAGVYEAGHNAVQYARMMIVAGQMHDRLRTEAEEQKAADCFTKGIAALQSKNDPADLGAAWWALGSAKDSLNQRGEARDAFDEALPLLALSAPPLAQGMVLCSLANDEKILHHYQSAIDDEERALLLLKDQPQAKSERFMAWMNLGLSHEGLEHKSEATDAFQNAFEEAEKDSNLSGAAMAEMKIADLHSALSEKRQAIAWEEKALDLYGRAHDKAGQATALASIGSKYATLGEYRKSLTYELNSLALLSGDSPSDRFQRAVVLYTIGDAYNALHDSVKALDYLQQSLTFYDPKTNGPAGPLASMCEVYTDLGQREIALEKCKEALAIAKRFGSTASQNKILNDIAMADEWLTGREEPQRIWTGLLKNDQERKDVQQEASTTNNLGELARFYGDFGEAKRLYLRALDLNKQLGDQHSQAQYLEGLAATEDALGEEDKALRSLNEALAIGKALRDSALVTKVLVDLARFQLNRGDYQHSLDTYNEGLRLIQNLQAPDTKAILLNGIASTYSEVGEYDLANDYFHRALAITEEVKDDFDSSQMLNNVAVNAQRAGKRSEALRNYAAALKLAEKTGNQMGESRLLSSESVIYSDEGNTKQALENLDRALKLALAAHDVDSEALAIHNRAGIYDDMNDLPSAKREYEHALQLWRTIGDSSAAATALSAKAKVERKQGDYSVALADVREAMRLGEQVRHAIGSSSLRASLTSQWSYRFGELEVDLLMRLDSVHPGNGYDVQAFEANERGRARSLIETLRQGHLDVHKQVDPELRQRQEQIENNMDAKAAEQMKLAGSPAAQTEVRRLESEMEDLRVQSDNLDAQIREKNPGYAALTQPQPVSLKQLQKAVVDKGSLLLEYSLGEEHSYLWVVGPDSFHAYLLPNRSAVENGAREFDDLVSNGAQNPEARRAAAHSLSTVLLKPAANELGNKRLIIVADGELQRVSFAIVPDPQSATGEPLLANHEVINQPSASVLALQRQVLKGRKRAPKTIAVIADPIFQASDERLATVGAKPAQNSNAADLPDNALERLPYTADEGKRILADVRSKNTLLLTGLQASKARVENGDLSQYRVLHFATHGLPNGDHPELAGLVLSLYNNQGERTDGFLRVNEIYNLQLPADLVVLSACESGRGKLLNGEGVVGLTRPFLYAGAKTIVVSLWSVNDASTAELMARFYGEMFGRKHLRPSAALRAAQLSMRSDPHWSDPYYWAAFTLQGDWR